MDQTTIALVAVAITAIANVILQFLAKLAMARKVQVDASTAALAQKGIEEAQVAAELAAQAAWRVKTALVEANAATAADLAAAVARLEENTTLTRQNGVIGRENTQTIKIVHELVNNKWGVALATIAALARQVALLTGRSEDAKTADEAEQTLNEHNDRQSTVDAGLAKSKESS